MGRPMTPNGYATLRRELKKLKASRPELARAIEVARAHGDLSENADYDAAKNKSGMTEAKIRDIESKLAGAQVIDPLKIAGFEKVVFGLTARIEDMDSGESKTLRIVGSEESNVEKGLISYEAPLGKALIGKRVGDTARLERPGGAREYEIVEIFCDYQQDPEAVEEE